MHKLSQIIILNCDYFCLNKHNIISSLPITKRFALVCRLQNHYFVRYYYTENSLQLVQIEKNTHRWNVTMLENPIVKQ